ncbi:unnamed protein product, partial [Sphenostylis stenocarpa]
MKSLEPAKHRSSYGLHTTMTNQREKQGKFKYDTHCDGMAHGWIAEVTVKGGEKITEAAADMPLHLTYRIKCVTDVKTMIVDAMKNVIIKLEQFEFSAFFENLQRILYIPVT